jgi:hypothetical protein
MNTQIPLKTWSDSHVSVYSDKVVMDEETSRKEMSLQEFLSLAAERYRGQPSAGEMDEVRRYVKALLETKAP